MNTTLIMGIGGLTLLTTIIGIVLEQSGRIQHSKLLELATILTVLGVILGLLAADLNAVRSTFGLF